jgi:hypothetical protein
MAMTLTRSEQYHMTTTAERAFNRPQWEEVPLTPAQVERLLSTHCILTDSKGWPTASWFWEYQEGPIPTKLEVFRAYVRNDQGVHERRVGVALPPFLAEIVEGA